MPKPFTIDQASFEAFTTELIAAGFEPVPQTEQRRWKGPISPSFSGLTDATTMVLCFRDGWPFRHPQLFVSGLYVDHVNALGEVCLWREDDPSREWLNLESILHRISEWCLRAKSTFLPTDHALDAYLAFGTTSGVLASFDTTDLFPHRPHRGQFGELFGIQHHPFHIELFPLRRGVRPAGSLRGHWFHVGEFDPPLRNPDEIRGALTRSQRRTFDKVVRRVQSRGEIELVVVAGHHNTALDIIVERLIRDELNIANFEHLEPAPDDQRTLSLRAGPFAQRLKDKRILIFGTGAIGSHVALILAESGVGHLHLADGELLRPGNVVRHAAGLSAIGHPKAIAVKAIIHDHVRWTEVTTTTSSVWHPSILSDLVSEFDLVVDATGMGPFTDMISRITGDKGTALVSAALYRGGSISRVRRQLPSLDVPIFRRGEDERYVVIPAGDTRDVESLELGCSAPVNNAPPSSVVAISALAAQVIIDVLSGRNEYPDDVLDVYQALDKPPFNQLGRVRG